MLSANYGDHPNAIVECSKKKTRIGAGTFNEAETAEARVQKDFSNWRCKATWVNDRGKKHVHQVDKRLGERFQGCQAYRETLVADISVVRERVTGGPSERVIRVMNVRCVDAPPKSASARRSKR